MPSAWARRNPAQLKGFPDGTAGVVGGGSISWRFRITQSLEAAIVMPVVASSLWMPTWPPSRIRPTASKETELHHGGRAAACRAGRTTTK